MKVGVISDTHGALPERTAEVFRGVELIVHAGDIGGAALLGELERLAPVIAVRGNYDTEPGLASRLLPDPSTVMVGAVQALLTHRLITMDWEHNRGLIAGYFKSLMPASRLFIFGHTHFPVLENIGGVWFVNSGYAGPDPLEGRRTAALIEVSADEISGEIVSLEP